MKKNLRIAIINLIVNALAKMSVEDFLKLDAMVDSIVLKSLMPKQQTSCCGTKCEHSDMDGYIKLAKEILGKTNDEDCHHDYDEEAQALRDWQDELDEREDDIEAREAELNEKEAELNEREAELEAREAAISDMEKEKPTIDYTTQNVCSIIETLLDGISHYTKK